MTGCYVVLNESWGRIFVSCCCRAATLNFFSFYLSSPPPLVPSTHILAQDSVGAGGPLAELPGFSQYDHVLHGDPGPLSCQRDRQLAHTHLLVHSTGKEMDPCVHSNRKLKSHQMNELFMSWSALGRTWSELKRWLNNKHK